MISAPQTLIIYYSRTGNTASIARQIAQIIGADVFELNTKDAFPKDMSVTADVAIKQYQSGQLPELVETPTLSSYQRILIGSPVWNGKLATPIARYLQETQFSQQQVGLFCSSVGQAANVTTKGIKGTTKILPTLFLVGSVVTADQVNQWLVKDC